MAIGSGKNMPVLSDDILGTARQEYIRGKGRPTKLSPALAAEICNRLECGETLKRICEDSHMPNRGTVNDWTRFSTHFADMIAYARLNSGDALADDALEILDSTTSANNLTVIRSAEVRAKMRLELARCFNRDVYGNQQKITGSVSIEHTVGGIIELISGTVKPLVCQETEDATLI